jgi:hypothetical protein
MGLGILMKVLSKLTDQEVFDLAYNGVVNQGGACFVRDEHIPSGFRCVYRAEDKMCAAGHVLAACYPPEWSGWGFEGDFSDFRFMEGIDVRFDTELLITALQEAHDTRAAESNYLDGYKERMARLAEDFDLKFKG